MSEISKILLQELYSQEYSFITQKGRGVKLSPVGSASLLAVGYKGTIALRKLRGWKFENGKVLIPKSFKQNVKK
jgi:hypothetical protein